MRTVRPYRFGSDCEFGFMAMDKLWAYKFLNARDILRVGNTGTFIGTDGHASTGEIRPRPAHNVRQHVMDLADALVAIQKWLKSSKKTSSAWIMALPYYNGETYGGHIHCSFTYTNEAMREMAAMGLDWRGDRFGGNTPIPDDMIAKAAYLAQRAGERPTPEEFMKVMNTLVRPFEYAVQPWDLRAARNESYGKEGDVRNQGTHPPAHLSGNYLHYEYRVPSTWLAHPELAYAYLGLAKLTMLNYDLIKSMGLPKPKLESQRESADVFLERFRKLQEKSPIITKDLHGLGDRFDRVFENLERWFAPMKPVAIEDWSRYAG